MKVWLVIAAAGLGSYVLRISMLVVAARAALPPVIERAARFAVPTAFAALAATSWAHQVRAGVGALAPTAAIAVAVVAVRRTGSSHAALLAGLPTLWILSALWG